MYDDMSVRRKIRNIMRESAPQTFIFLGRFAKSLQLEVWELERHLEEMFGIGYFSYFAYRIVEGERGVHFTFKRGWVE